MKKCYLQVIFIFTLLFVSILNLSSEKSIPTVKIRFELLPLAIQEEFQKVADVNSITEIELEKEYEGISVYELETQKNGTQVVYIYSNDGTLLEIERTIQYEELPEISRKMLEEKYPNLDIKMVESIQINFFEVKGKLDGKTIELKIFNDGNIELEEEDEEEEEEID